MLPSADAWRLAAVERIVRLETKIDAISSQFAEIKLIVQRVAGGGESMTVLLDLRAA